MWVYKQSTGELFRYAATGYSGLEEAKNQPNLQDVKGRGPIPRGKWRLGEPFDGGTHGPYCLRLTPLPGTATFGRDGFLVHGDAVKAPGTASHGCIILPRTVRELLWTSGDHDVEVIA